MAKKKEEIRLSAKSDIIAFEDLDFLKTEELRSVRLQLEFLKPDLIMDQFKVQSTFVIFGSARTKSLEDAQAMLKEAQDAYDKNPNDDTKEALAKAKRALEDSHYYQVARELAAMVTKESQAMDKTDRTYVVITGGGGGIMEAGNRGATEAGGITAALNITLPFEQHPNSYITPELSFLLHYFSIRKMHFLKRAKALAAFPGGFGTMDELFEALTLIQTHKIPKMPVLLYGKSFWENLINWKYFEERGMISKGDTDIFTYCESAEEGWNIIKKFYNLK